MLRGSVIKVAPLGILRALLSLSPNAEALYGSTRVSWLGAVASDDAKCLDYIDKVGR
jgi:hypothetical protein